MRLELEDMELPFSSPAHTRRVQQLSTDSWGYDWRLQDILRAVCVQRPEVNATEDYGSLVGDHVGDVRETSPHRRDGTHFVDALHLTHLVDTDGLSVSLVEISVWAFSIDNYSNLRGLLDQLAAQMRRDTRGGTFVHGARRAFEVCVDWCWTRLNEFLVARAGYERDIGHRRYGGCVNGVRALREALVREMSRGGRLQSLQQSLADISRRVDSSSVPFGWRVLLVATLYAHSCQPPHV